MRNTVMVAAGLMAIGTCRGGERTVTVCLAPNLRVAYHMQELAQGYATRLYRTAGVQLRWKHFCTAGERDAAATPLGSNLTTIGMEWAVHAGEEVSPKAYALARPYQQTGTRITLFVDRLGPAMEEPSRGAAILGHVFAHEIGHVLLGHNGHAKSGLMKETWSTMEQSGMNCHLMRFSSEQAEEIRRALDRIAPHARIATCGEADRSQQGRNGMTGETELPF
jgi:hypothetical protein